MKLLAFGGPLNDQVVYVPNDQNRVVVALPVAAGSYLADDEPCSAVGARMGVYNVERVAAGTWEAKCLVYDGYPRHRITDALNAIAAMARLATILVPHAPRP